MLNTTSNYLKMFKTKINYCCFFLTIIIIASCARPYRKVNMESIPFVNYKDDAKIRYSIRQGVFYNFKDYYYARKELKNDYNLIAFSIVNKSELPINTSELTFMCGASVIMQPTRMADIYSVLKQKAGLYWLYSAGVAVYPKPAVMTINVGGTPTQINKPDDPKKLIKNGKQFIPIPFGVVFGAANFGIAYRANKKLKSQLELFDLSNKIIQPGDSIKGWLPFRNVANCGDIFISVKE